jgi:hypothetical protein
MLWMLPWGLSALWAALGLIITGYGDIGACTSNPSYFPIHILIFFPRYTSFMTDILQGAGSHPTESASS